MTLLINDFTYKMTLLITVNKKHICNVTFINFMSKVITSEVFISIVFIFFFFFVAVLLQINCNGYSCA